MVSPEHFASGSAAAIVPKPTRVISAVSIAIRWIRASTCVRRSNGRRDHESAHRHHHRAAAVARAGGAARAQAGRTGRLLPSRLHGVRKFLPAIIGRAGRDSVAAKRQLSARVDPQRVILSRQWRWG